MCASALAHARECAVAVGAVEYATALLMNLSLRTQGKARLARPALATLDVLCDYLEAENSQVRTYINGTLYSVLSHRPLRERARAMGLADILQGTCAACECTTSCIAWRLTALLLALPCGCGAAAVRCAGLQQHSADPFRRQLAFILDQLRVDGDEEEVSPRSYAAVVTLLRGGSRLRPCRSVRCRAVTTTTTPTTTTTRATRWRRTPPTATVSRTPHHHTTTHGTLPSHIPCAHVFALGSGGGAWRAVRRRAAVRRLPRGGRLLRRGARADHHGRRARGALSVGVVLAAGLARLWR